VSFRGGLGLDFGIGFRWCGIFGCYDPGVKHLSLFTTAHESAGVAPLTGQRLQVATTSCPSVGLIPVEGIPVNPLELGICQGLALDGRAFEARVEAAGGQDPSLGVLSFDPAPIAGVPVAFEVTGLNGTPSTAAVVTTDSRGIAALPLPPGEYTIAARFAGTETYLPSTATQHPVYVYRPTTFVIWGGNPDGLQPGTRYQFWGAQWTTQVASGDFAGNASFQGFALPLDAAVWQSPPAASARVMPAALADVTGVIVTTRVSGRGSWSIGNIAGHAVLRVDQPHAYRPAAGHDAWGTLRLELP
jgi:hypothetical protein